MYSFLHSVHPHQLFFAVYVAHGQGIAEDVQRVTRKVHVCSKWVAVESMWDIVYLLQLLFVMFAAVFVMAT